LKFDEDNGTVSYRWKADEPGFAMPVLRRRQGLLAAHPTHGRWQTMKTPLKKTEFAVATDLYYVTVTSSSIYFSVPGSAWAENKMGGRFADVLRSLTLRTPARIDALGFPSAVPPRNRNRRREDRLPLHVAARRRLAFGEALAKLSPVVRLGEMGASGAGANCRSSSSPPRSPRRRKPAAPVSWSSTPRPTSTPAKWTARKPS